MGKATKAQVGRVSCALMNPPDFPPGCQKPQGLTLLGARPKQAWLDWDEALLFTAAQIRVTSLAAASEALVADPCPLQATAESSCIVDLVWLRDALGDEVTSCDAEGLLAAVEVIVGDLDVSSDGIQEALE